MRTAILGSGDVAHYYLDYLTRSERLAVVACADRDPATAERRAGEYGLAAVSPEDLLADTGIELVLNLTPASAHAEVTRQLLEAGKHVFSEKPLAMTLAEAEELAELARGRGLGLAVAPDTFLGPSLQTAKRLVEDDAIGEVVGAAGSFTAPGSDLWHPNPDHILAAGPIFDEGVYFLTALVHLLGPLEAVAASSRTVRGERTIGAGPRAGERFTAASPTHYVAILRHAAGPLVTMLMSFEAVGSTQPALELYGTTGTLSCAFPGFYDGPLQLGRRHGPPWEEIQPEGETLGRVRGPGVEDLVDALRDGREPACGPRLGLHVLDATETVVRAAETGAWERLRTA